MKYSTEIQQSTEIFFRENQRFRTNFSGQRKKYRKTEKNIKDLQLEYEKKKCNYSKKQKQNKKKTKKKLIREHENGVLSDLHTVRQVWRGKSQLC